MYNLHIQSRQSKVMTIKFKILIKREFSKIIACKFHKEIWIHTNLKISLWLLFDILHIWH